ncbi:hypothetical protein [Achromobacter dolens]|uniref:hypothetical protein n=1 Tax=Achromobacter dolens TaxID=1287738 RepID=UPI00300D0823
MTNSYDVAHGLSQDAPGPLEPVEIAQQPGAAPATGNTARDQEMYAAGIRTGEENAKHNAAIRAAAGWLPIESAPKDGTEIWAYNGEQARMRWVEGECYALWIWADDLLADADPSPEQPTYWQPVPAAPGVSTVEVARKPDFPSAGQIIDDYIQEYELRGEDDEGRDGVYSPTDTERYMIVDAIYGLLAETEFIAAIAGMQNAPAAGDALAPELDLEAAAKALAECMDYPWEWMPEKGRAQMRMDAQAVIDAAITAQRKGDA